MVETHRSEKYNIIKEHLDWVEIEGKIIDWRQRWLVKGTNTKVVTLVPKNNRYLGFIYRLFKGYQKEYWDIFTIDKNKKFTVEAWGNRRKTRIYLMDSQDKVLIKFPSLTALRNTVVDWWPIDDIYSKVKKDFCPRMKYVIEEDYYWDQYKILVD